MISLVAVIICRIAVNCASLACWPGCAELWHPYRAALENRTTNGRSPAGFGQRLESEVAAAATVPHAGMHLLTLAGSTAAAASNHPVIRPFR